MACAELVPKEGPKGSFRLPDGPSPKSQIGIMFHQTQPPPQQNVSSICLRTFVLSSSSPFGVKGNLFLLDIFYSFPGGLSKWKITTSNRKHVPPNPTPLPTKKYIDPGGSFSPWLRWSMYCKAGMAIFATSAESSDIPGRRPKATAQPPKIVESTTAEW